MEASSQLGWSEPAATSPDVWSNRLAFDDVHNSTGFKLLQEKFPLRPVGHLSARQRHVMAFRPSLESGGIRDDADLVPRLTPTIGRPAISAATTAATTPITAA